MRGCRWLLGLWLLGLWLLAPSAEAASPDLAAEAAERVWRYDPWALVLGLGLASVLLWRRRRWLCAALGSRPWLGLLVLAGASVGGLGLAPRGYLHMNGQGPLWTDFALGQPSAYGPGFAELFGWAARAAGRTPEQGVFALHAVMLSIVPLLVFLALRAVRTPLRLSWAISILAALDPMRARLAGSESYYGVGYMLVGAACAAVCVGFNGFRSGCPKSRERALLGVLAAGAFIAQAARTHPILWVPCAAVPLMVLALPGQRRGRLLQAAVAAAGIAVMVAVLAGSVMHQTLTGPSDRWLLHGPPWWAFTPQVWHVVVGVIWLAAGRRRGDAAVRIAVLLAVLSVARFVTHLSAFTEQIHAAHLRLFAPYVLILIGALAAMPLRWAPGARSSGRGWLRGWLPTFATCGAGLLYFMWNGSSWGQLTTDAAEQNWMLSWRDTLPRSAKVAGIQNAGDRIMRAPFHSMVRGHPRMVAPNERPDFAYLGSLCATADGAAKCAEIEALPHEVVGRREVPALESYDGFGYRTDPVVLRLLKIKSNR